MENRLLKFLDCNQYLRDHIDIFKKYFVCFYTRFYGDDIKEEIDDKFSKCLFIGYQSPSSLKGLLREIAKSKSNELIDSMLKDSSVILTKEDLFSNYDFTYSSLQPINNYLEFYKLYRLGEDGRRNAFYKKKYSFFHKYLPDLTFNNFMNIIDKKEIPKIYDLIPLWLKSNFEYVFDSNNITKEYLNAFLKSFSLLSKVDSSINQNNFNDKLRDNKFVRLNQLVEKYADAIDEFTLYMKKFQIYTDYVTATEKLEHELNDKYYAKFIRENLDLIPSDKREGLEDFFAEPGKSYRLNPYVKKAFGYSLFSEVSLLSFSKEYEEEFHGEHANSWRVYETKKRRVSYFKSNGLDFGDNYDDYLDKDEVKAIWPSYERIEQLKHSYDELLNQYNNEYFNSLTENKKIRHEIEELGVLDKNDSFDATIYQKYGTILNSNVTLNSTGYDTFSLLVVGCDHACNFNDYNIVHELNHLFELFLDSVNDENYSIISGWDSFTSQIKDSKSDAETIHIDDYKRPYELFNEIVNELISQEICQMMHDDGVFIFDDPMDSQFRNVTSYDYSLFLVRDFCEQNKDAIIKSRRNGNIQHIFDTVGQENFDELNSLFEMYYENFSGFKIYGLLDSLKNGEDTDATRVYYDLVGRKNQIMSNMDVYKNRSVEKKQTMKNTI